MGWWNDRGVVFVCSMCGLLYVSKKRCHAEVPPTRSGSIAVSSYLQILAPSYLHIPTPLKTRHTDRAGNSSGGFCRLSQFDVFPTPLKIQYRMIRIGYVCTWGPCPLLYVSRKRGHTEVPPTRIDSIAMSSHSPTSYPRILISLHY